MTIRDAGTYGLVLSCGSRREDRITWQEDVHDEEDRGQAFVDRRRVDKRLLGDSHDSAPLYVLRYGGVCHSVGSDSVLHIPNPVPEPTREPERGNVRTGACFPEKFEKNFLSAGTGSWTII